MKALEFEFDDEIFGESNFRTNKVQESYKPKQCEPEVCLKAAIIAYSFSNYTQCEMVQFAPTSNFPSCTVLSGRHMMAV